MIKNNLVYIPLNRLFAIYPQGVAGPFGSSGTPVILTFRPIYALVLALPQTPLISAKSK